MKFHLIFAVPVFELSRCAYGLVDRSVTSVGASGRVFVGVIVWFVGSLSSGDEDVQRCP